VELVVEETETETTPLQDLMVSMELSTLVVVAVAVLEMGASAVMVVRVWLLSNTLILAQSQSELV
jgi:hypothetical protein